MNGSRPKVAEMNWAITVIDPERQRVFFAGKSLDREEVYRVADEARRLRPQATIYVRPPIGELIEWP